MSYLVLARKYRPETFGSVAGQEHVTRTLQNAIKRDRVAHAYVFSGPRGVGKTSIARILAKTLNCQKLDESTFEPCLACSSCEDISKGNSLAVREIDGASHNSVDNVRDLIDSFRALPAPGSKYKIYIIDEVHMLSTAAFNALLKSLEEPPPHTLFILATTEPHKIPDTVMSRCQRHDFRALTVDTVEEQLQSICKQEKVKVESEALRMIARLSDGSMRDAQTLLDRVRSYCEDSKITAAETSLALGTVERKLLFELSAAIFKRDTETVLAVIEKVFSTGTDPALFLEDLVTHFRELLVAKYGNEEALSSFGVSGDDMAELRAQCEAIEGFDLQDLVHLVRTGADNALRSGFPRYSAEALLVRAATREPVKNISDILAGMRNLMKNPRVVSSPEKASSPVATPSTAAVKKKVHIQPDQIVEEEPVEVKARVNGAPEPVVGEQPSWSKFVDHCSRQVSPLLAEQMKRITAREFSTGTLVLEGQRFHIQSISSAENKTRLTQALNDFLPAFDWRIEFHEKGKGGLAEPGSLEDQNRQRIQRRKVLKREEILAHPKVQSIRKAFPGTIIEKVRIKE